MQISWQQSCGIVEVVVVVVLGCSYFADSKKLKHGTQLMMDLIQISIAGKSDKYIRNTNWAAVRTCVNLS